MGGAQRGWTLSQRNTMGNATKTPPSSQPTTFKIAMAIISYSLCSSMMVVANKLAINAVQISAVVTQTQFVFATAVVLLAG